MTQEAPIEAYTEPTDDLPELADAELPGLTERERAFVRLYLGPHFGRHREAMLAAGFPKRAIKRAGALLRKPAVASAIRQNLYFRGATPARTIAEIAVYAFGLRAADYEPYVEGRMSLADLEAQGVPTQAVSSVKSTSSIRYGPGGEVESETVTREVKLRDPQKALDQLVKVLGLGAQAEHIHAEDGIRAPVDAELVDAIDRMLAAVRPTVTGVPVPKLDHDDEG